MRIPELVAPAGNPEKLKTALHFGADAVYLGLKRFSMRSFAGNFDWDQLEWAIGYAHERGKRVIAVVNVQPFDPEFEELEQTLRTLGQLKPDAVVVGDPGVLFLARRVAPHLRYHLSTQASTTNAEAAAFWRAQGIERIVLARELSLEHLAALGQRAPELDVELETFVHGAMCIAFSGRCFMSLYWAGSKRDPRHGSCAQSCRWPYKTIQETRGTKATHEIAEDERGTYFFDTRDLCAMPVLDRLVATGVHALKIEGRTRNDYYVSTVVDVYRDALDRLAVGDVEGWRERIPFYTAELKSACKREFSTHFLTDSQNDPNTYQPDGSPVGGAHACVGKVALVGDGYLDLRVRSVVRPGESLELCDAGLLREAVPAGPLSRPDGELLDLARPGDVIRVFGSFKAGSEALVRRPGEDPAEEVGGCSSCG